MAISSVRKTTSAVSQIPDGRAACWLTTSDAAKTLQVTRHGLRWLAQSGALACERTESGQRLFRSVDVDRLATQRGQARRSRALVLRSAHGPIGQPRQLSLFGKARLRLVDADKSENVLRSRVAKVL